MANTVQKRIKWSKGQISPELVERTDLATFDSSAQTMDNFVSTIYGGVRSRVGTKFIDYITDINEQEPEDITSDLFEDTSDFGGLEYKTSGQIGSGRVIADIDYGEYSPTGACTIEVKNISVVPFVNEFTTAGSSTVNLEAGRYIITAAGAGGGGSYSYDNDRDYKSRAAGGSGGGYGEAVFDLLNGTYSVLVGTGGLKAGNGYLYGGWSEPGTPTVFGESVTLHLKGYSTAEDHDPVEGKEELLFTRNIPQVGDKAIFISGETVTYDGEVISVSSQTITVKFVIDGQTVNGVYSRDTDLDEDLSIPGIQTLTATGGGGAWTQYKQVSQHNPGGTATIVGAETIIKKEDGRVGGSGEGSASANGGASWISGTNYGAGGNATHTSSQNGYPGYVKITQLDTDLVLRISTSDNGETYTEAAQEVVTSTERDIRVDLEFRPRYVRIEIVTDQVLQSSLKFQYLRNDISTSEGDTVVKLEKFVYNNTDKYLLVISNEKIQIFKDDVLETIVTATGLDKSYLKELKVTQKDDTCIFTHQEMPPKILKRTYSDGVVTWSWSDLDIKNIPYVLFGPETTTTKTVKITPNYLEGAVKMTAASAVFDSTWVGQYIDGNGGRMKITEYVSSTVVNGYTVIPFYTIDGINNWDYISGYEPVWSETRGYPRTCLFAQQRLWFGGSKDKPASVWGSRLGDYFNFKNSGNYDNDSINVDLLTNDVIINMVDNRGLHIFTTGQEITASEGSLTPNSISFTINTQNGSLQGVEPIVVDGVVFFAEKNGKSLLSYVYNYEQAAYLTDNVSLFCDLISYPVDMDANINSSKDKGNFIYLVLRDGTMLVDCVSVPQEVNSITHYKTNGNITSVCCVLDDKYIIVERNGRSCLEKFEETKCDSEETRYISSSTLYGLYRYVGSKVYVYSDEKVYFKGRVLSDKIDLNEIPYEYCKIGIAYDYELVGNPIAINHQTTSLKKRISTAELVCTNTPQITFCGQTKKYQDNYKFFSCTKYDDDTRYKISGEFYPVQILSLQLNINYEG